MPWTSTYGFQNVEPTIETILKSFETYCIGETNESYERFRFNSRNQESGETVDKYITELRKLAKTCNFATLEDSLIRDRIIMGLQCDVTRRKLLQESKLTLSKCIDTARSMEASKRQLHIIQGETIQVQSINSTPPRQLQQYATPRPNRTRPQFSPNPPKPTKECYFCGKRHPLRKELCPGLGENVF